MPVDLLHCHLFCLLLWVLLFIHFAAFAPMAKYCRGGRIMSFGIDAKWHLVHISESQLASRNWHYLTSYKCRLGGIYVLRAVQNHVRINLNLSWNTQKSPKVRKWHLENELMSFQYLIKAWHFWTFIHEIKNNKAVCHISSILNAFWENLKTCFFRLSIICWTAWFSLRSVVNCPNPFFFFFLFFF